MALSFRRSLDLLLGIPRVPVRRTHRGSRTTGSSRGNAKSNITGHRRAYADLVRPTIDAKKRLRLLGSSIGCRVGYHEMKEIGVFVLLNHQPAHFRNWIEQKKWRKTRQKGGEAGRIEGQLRLASPRGMNVDLETLPATSNYALNYDGTNTSGVSPGRPAIRVTGGRGEQQQSVLFCRGM